MFATEPPAKDHPLLGLENAVLTPHLGASTDEAQTAVIVEACKAIVAYLNKGEIRGAVNAGGLKLDLPPDEAPFADLARRIGHFCAGFSEGGYKTITLRASGARARSYEPRCLRLATVELLKPHLDTPSERDQCRAPGQEPGYRVGDDHEPIRRRAWSATSSASAPMVPTANAHRILGTVYADGLPRVLRVDNFAMDMVPEGHMVLIINRDQPGVIGLVGTHLRRRQGQHRRHGHQPAHYRARRSDGASTLIKTDTPVRPC